MVELILKLGESSLNTPFEIEARELAIFKWEKDYEESNINILLSQNAPALLLSYLRPIIANVTSASQFSAYNIPFINFKK